MALAIFIAAPARADDAPMPTTQRVVEIERLARDYGVEPPGTPRRPIRGVVRTADGSPLPGDAIVRVHARQHGSSTTNSARVDAEGRFEHDVGGAVTLVAGAPGFAPAASAVIRADADGTFAPAELVLARGIDVPVRIVDESGEPVPQAIVTAGHVFRRGGARIELPAEARDGRTRADDAGGVTIANAPAGWTLALRVSADGFQAAQAEVAVDAGGATVTLLAATTTAGSVVDADTLEPIAGARLTLVRRTNDAGEQATWIPGRNDPRAASGAAIELVADAAGRFSTDALADGFAYDFLATADGRGCTMARRVRAGRDDVVVRLGARRPVTVRVVAPPGLDPAKRPTQVKTQQQLRFDSTGHHVLGEVPIVWDGDAGTATLADPWPNGRPQFTLDGVWVSADPLDAAPPPTLTVPMPAPPVAAPAAPAPAVAAAPAPTSRPIVCRVVTTDGSPAVGSLTIYATGEGSSTSAALPLMDGAVRLSLVPPGRLRVTRSRVFGHWVAAHDDDAQIDAGDGPFTFDVPAWPAGAIHGVVREADGSPSTAAFNVAFETVTPSPDVNDRRRPASYGQNAYNDGDARYCAPDLPLGGTYRVVVTDGPRIVAGEPIALDAATPVRNVDVAFPPGRPLTVTVRGPDGEPVPFRPVRLTARRHGVDGGPVATATRRTDHLGRVRFENVVTGSARLSLLVTPDDRTQGANLPLLDPASDSVEVKLRDGLTARGRVLDVTTGMAIRDAIVSLVPAEADGYRDGILASTDADGVFVARGLEPVAYRVEIRDTYPPTAQVMRDPDGKVVGIRMDGGNVPEPTLRGGSPDLVDFPRVRSPMP